MKLRLFTALAVSIALAAFSACSFEVDEEARSTQNKLVGYWETCHVKEEDITTEADGTVTSVYVDEDVSLTSDNRVDYYGVLRFTETTVSYVATFDPEVIINLPYSYTLTGNRLYSWLTRGDYAEFVTIEELTDDRLVLKLDDEGTDEDGIHDDFLQIITLRRIY